MLDIVGLIPSFGNALYTLGAFVVALSVIVAVHEYGHYIVGRWCGIRAEVFSIGFGPVLMAWRDRLGTTWQVAALPFGGYVKFLGDANAASAAAADDFDSMDEETRRSTMHGAPLWARAATVAAGPACNVIFSIFIFSCVLMYRGIAADPLTIDELRPVPGGAAALRPGDEVLAVAGVEAPSAENINQFADALPAADRLVEYRIRRDGAEMSVSAPHPYPPLVLGLTPGSAAMDAELRPGDVILSVDGRAVSAFSELREAVEKSEGRELALEVWRGGDVFQVALAPRKMDLPLSSGGFDTRYLIGITGGLLFSPKLERPGILEAVLFGAGQTYFVVRSSLSGIYHMAAGAISSCNLQGPVGIAQTSGAAASQGLMSFIWFIAFLSTAVGLLNLFPIPILDGGHLVFHAYEAATGRPPSEQALKILVGIGLALLATLMVFALANDFLCP